MKKVTVGEVTTKEEYIAEEELPPEDEVDGPVIESIVGGCCSDLGDVASYSSYVKGLCIAFFIQLSI